MDKKKIIAFCITLAIVAFFALGKIEKAQKKQAQLNQIGYALEDAQEKIDKLRSNYISQRNLSEDEILLASDKLYRQIEAIDMLIWDARSALEDYTDMIYED